MKYTAIVEQSGNNTGIPVPDEIVAALGAGKRPKVVVTLGHHSYRSSVSPYQGKNMLPLSAANRTAAGVAGGDEVVVGLVVDDARREVEVPTDLAAALAAAPEAKSAFEALSYSNQRAHVLAVEGA